MTTFRAVFLATVAATALLVGAFLIHRQRPAAETAQPTAALVRATGKCASCHREETGAIVVEYERSRHAARDVNCLDCHGPQAGQESYEHRGFTLARALTAKNCASCHADQQRQFLRSRHAAPAWAAVHGAGPFTAEQVEFAERYHEGAVDRPPNALARIEGPRAIAAGCESCHAIGAPNADGSIGTCTECHARHRASIVQARVPATCGQCHMGPDHSQIEIYRESKHGVLFDAMRDEMNLAARPEDLSVEDMSVPTCATCHMSGLGGSGVTHDVGERLSYWLFDVVSERRPNYLRAQVAMKEICLDCHTEPKVDAFYERAEDVVESTNERVAEAEALMDALYAEGLLTAASFDEPIEYTWFDLWHYYGRTAKHGAFMGGADFVQWHGTYEIVAHRVELEEEAEALRAGAGGGR